MSCEPACAVNVWRLEPRAGPCSQESGRGSDGRRRNRDLIRALEDQFITSGAKHELVPVPVRLHDRRRMETPSGPVPVVTSARIASITVSVVGSGPQKAASVVP